MTTQQNAGDKLKSRIKEQADDDLAIEAIDQYLKKKGQRYPNQFIAKAVFEFVSTDSPHTCNEFLLDFIMGVEMVMQRPENRRLVIEEKELVTAHGMEEGFRLLKGFLSRFYEEPFKAEMYRIGLTEYNDRYSLPATDASEVLEEVQEFR